MINFLTKKNIFKKMIMLSLANIISFNAISQGPNKNSSDNDLAIVKKIQQQQTISNILNPIKNEYKPKAKIAILPKGLISKLIPVEQHIITTSKIDWDKSLTSKEKGNYPDLRFDLYIKNSQKKGNLGQKLSYWRTGLFKLDSLSGLETGYEFDLIPEGFERPKGNTFRYWNRLRMGAYLVSQINTHYPIGMEDIINNLDAELTVRYLHIPDKLRGDQTLSKRKGYVSAFLGIKTNHDKVLSLGMKLSGKSWIKAGYKDRHYNGSLIDKSIGLGVEVLTNKEGYRKSLTNLTKDYYKGFSFIIGGGYNFVNNSPYINLGLRFVTRNH